MSIKRHTAVNPITACSLLPRPSVAFSCLQALYIPADNSSPPWIITSTHESEKSVACSANDDQHFIEIYRPIRYTYATIRHDKSFNDQLPINKTSSARSSNRRTSPAFDQTVKLRHDTIAECATSAIGY